MAGSCRQRRYADHIFIQIYFRMHHFVGKFSKFSSPHEARGHLPLTKILRTFLHTTRQCHDLVGCRVTRTVGAQSVSCVVDTLIGVRLENRKMRFDDEADRIFQAHRPSSIFDF